MRKIIDAKSIYAASISKIKVVLSNPRIFSKKLIRLLTYLILFDLAYIYIYPFLYMIVTSLKTNADLFDPTVNWIPRSIKLENFVMAFNALSFKQNAINSVLYTVFGTVGHVLSCSLIGYGFARYRFPGKTLLFAIVLTSIIIPVQTLIVPMYLFYANLHLLNSYIPVILPTFFGFGLRGALFIFIFRQFFMGLPKELEDAARIDGCGFIKTFFRIVLPISNAVLLVSTVLAIVWHWNDFYEPEFFAGRTDMLPLPVSIQSIIPLLESPARVIQLMADMKVPDAEKVINNAVFMAATVIVVLPILIVFIFLQKKFMQGIERTGLVE